MMLRGKKCVKEGRKEGRKIEGKYEGRGERSNMCVAEVCLFRCGCCRSV